MNLNEMNKTNGFVKVASLPGSVVTVQVDFGVTTFEELLLLAGFGTDGAFLLRADNVKVELEDTVQEGTKVVIKSAMIKGNADNFFVNEEELMAFLREQEEIEEDDEKELFLSEAYVENVIEDDEEIEEEKTMEERIDEVRLYKTNLMERIKMYERWLDEAKIELEAVVSVLHMLED